MPSDAGSNIEVKLQKRRKMAWSYLEERAKDISEGKVKPDESNELDQLAIQLAKTLPGLYKKIDEKIVDGELRTCI